MKNSRKPQMATRDMPVQMAHTSSPYTTYSPTAMYACIHESHYVIACLYFCIKIAVSVCIFMYTTHIHAYHTYSCIPHIFMYTRICIHANRTMLACIERYSAPLDGGIVHPWMV